MRLFHFSEDAYINRFEPRPLRVAAQRPPSMEWLNGSLVWAIDDAHQRLYLFPRECPRIVLWATQETTESDKAAWLGGLDEQTVAVAYVEHAWRQQLERCTLVRYEMPADTFVDTGDAGMWVSRSIVIPCARSHMGNLGNSLAECQTKLVFVESLVPFKSVWQSSINASGIRLRNAAGWREQDDRHD
jgi:hypothetical protein